MIKSADKNGMGEERGISPLRIVFMGTPDFAVWSLKTLVEKGYNVVGVVTTPDRAVGKHHSSLQPSPVKQYALSQNIPLLQPEKLRDPRFLESLKGWNADLQIVVAFRMLPEVVWNMPPAGTFNLHASLLPQYRGAAPINWAIINGETETGATTFFLTHEIDTGAIIGQIRIPVSEEDNAGTIHDRLMYEGAELVVRTVEDICHQRIRPVSQEKMLPADELRPAPKLFKETCKICWERPVKDVYDFIRGLSPYPGAWTEVERAGGTTLNLKIFEAERVEKEHELPPGTLVSDGKSVIEISAQGGFIRLKSLQQAGKRRMSADEFLRGNLK